MEFLLEALLDAQSFLELILGEFLDCLELLFLKTDLSPRWIEIQTSL